MTRITKITLKRVVDPSPDLSWLETTIEDGKIASSYRYSDKDIAEYGLDRVREWVAEDHKRLAECGQTWHMIGLFAEATVHTSADGGTDEGTWLFNTIRSGGIWNVESDSDEQYLQGLEAEELDQLRFVLADLGFTAEQIEEAIIRDLADRHVTEAVGIPYVDNLTKAQLRNVLAGIYRWIYWDEDEGRWTLDKDVSGADTVQMLCELLPEPPEPSE